MPIAVTLEGETTRCVIVNSLGARGTMVVLPHNQDKFFDVPDHGGPQQVSPRVDITAEPDYHQVSLLQKNGKTYIRHEPLSGPAAIDMSVPVSVTNFPYEEGEQQGVTVRYSRQGSTKLIEDVDFENANAVSPSIDFADDKIFVVAGHFPIEPAADLEKNPGFLVHLTLERGEPRRGQPPKETVVYLHNPSQAQLDVLFPKYNFLEIVDSGRAEVVERIEHLWGVAARTLMEYRPTQAVKKGLLEETTVTPSVSIEASRADGLRVRLYGQDDYRLVELVASDGEEAFSGKKQQGRYTHRPYRRFDPDSLQQQPLIGQGTTSISLNRASADRLNLTVRAYRDRGE